MKHKLGNILMILGCGLMAAALALFLYNRREQTQAGSASREVIDKVVTAIRQQNDPAETVAQTEQIPAVPTTPEERVMTTVEIDANTYIGFLGIPGLGLELPVMEDWSYPQLKIAPCRYTGSVFTDDFVIMAHNYPQHFGGLKDMKTGEEITFTDMEGNTTRYRVAALEILPPDSVEDVTSGTFALTLFTCTYGGENRVVLRCDRVSD